MPKNNQKFNDMIIDMIANVKEEAIAVTATYNGVCLLNRSFNGKEYRFFCLNKKNQNSVNYDLLRSFLFKEQGILSSENNADNIPVVEVIGDSSKFDLEGSLFAKQHFEREMNGFKGILLYGYTGPADTQGLVDANGIVNDYLDKNPSFARHVIANIVDFDTRVALGNPEQPVPIIGRTGYGAYVSPEVCNFLLVWDNCGPGALFGDDITVSDNLVNSKALLYGGGMQSFEQATNVLNNGYQVIGVTGVRGERNPATFIKEFNRHALLFEAALFFNFIKEKMLDPKKEFTPEEIIEFKDSYVSENPSAEERRAFLFNPFKADPPSKLAMWRRIWDNFMSNQTWRRVSALYEGFNIGTEKQREVVKPQLRF